MGQVESTAYDLMLKTLLSRKAPEISVQKASEPNNSIFLDARAKKEYEVSHIKNAIWVGYDSFNIKPLETISKDREIIVYCSVGYRSEKITEKLIKAGYKNVRNLYGGIFEWVNQSKPIFDSSDNLTLKIHAYNYMWGVWLNKGEKIYD